MRKKNRSLTICLLNTFDLIVFFLWLFEKILRNFQKRKNFTSAKKFFPEKKKKHLKTFLFPLRTNMKMFLESRNFRELKIRTSSFHWSCSYSIGSHKNRQTYLKRYLAVLLLVYFVFHTENLNSEFPSLR